MPFTQTGDLEGGDVELKFGHSEVEGLPVRHPGGGRSGTQESRSCMEKGLRTIHVVTIIKFLIA